MAYTFEQLLAADPSNPSNIAQNAAITIFAPGDETMTPLTITDPGGSPLPNPFTVNANGFGSAFAHATLDRVAWSGGGFTGYLTSYEGMKEVAVAAQAAAESAVSAANTANTNAAVSLAAAVADAEAAAASAASAASLVSAPADAAVKSLVTTQTSETAKALNSIYSKEDATAMQGRGLFVTSDSFGTVLNSITPYPDRIDADRGMAYASTAVGGQFFQDGFGRNWGADATVTGGVSADSYCLVAFGINPAFHRGDSAPNRAAERNSFEALLWLLAAQSVGPDTVWTTTGSWSSYSGGGSENMRGGSAPVTSTTGDYAETTPAAGDYVAIGYSFSAGIGAQAESGEYRKNGNVIAANYANDMTAGAPTTPNGSLIIPKPTPLIGLTGTDVIRTTHIGPGFMFVDSLIRLSTAPPWIIVVKPTYVTADSYFPTTDAEVDAYRADIDTVIASVTAKYAPLRGKIVVVDPVLSGWDREAHTDTDGLHPSAEGHEFLSKLVQRQVAYSVRLRQQLLTTGQLTA